MPETPAIAGEMPKTYAPAEHEDRIRARWDASGAFHADPGPVLRGERQPYCILIPPPNVTAALHLGHALNNTLQDALIRAHRMKGFEALWMPGTDHAGIATQAIVDKRLQSEGQASLKDYKELEARGEGGREQFIARVQAWKDEYEATIIDQLKRLGASCDWERQRFTMDPVCARAVREAFFRLFKAGLIYRGKRLVNWDPVLQTALADDEVEMREIKGFFFYLRYPLVYPSANAEDPKDCQEVTWNELATRGYPGAEKMPGEEVAWLTVATTRPETYLGDTAVAVNPKDPRAGALRGLMVQLPIVGRVIPVIEDDYVVLADPESSDPKAKYATGFLKVTPAHDPNDYLIGTRHDLEVINVLAPDASISDSHGWEREANNEDGRVFVGKSREDARNLVVREFESRNLLEAKKPYVHSVGHSDRSKVPIEPYLSDQWYVKVTDDRLVGEAQRALALDQRSTDSFLSPSGTGVPPVRTPDSPGIPDALTIHRRNLPHWQKGGETYFITFRVQSGTLSDAERQLTLDACFHWHNERAIIRLVTVMPDHVHLLLTPLRQPDGTWHPLPELMQSIKSFTAHEILRARGKQGALWQDEYFDRIIRDGDEFSEKWNYMVQNPVKTGIVRHPGDYPFTRWSDLEDIHVDVEGYPTKSDSHGRDAHATGEEEASDHAMRFYPSRYAKTYEAWHDNLRDWCISRQLWWGHRIPVWSRTCHNYDEFIDFWELGRDWPHQLDLTRSKFVHFEVDQGKYLEDASTIYAGVNIGPDGEHIWHAKQLEAAGFTQDPDVLDTWFSSALWPISTMGWPDPEQSAEFTGLLDAFNPSNVLSTGRDIITLWVSRMAMFNRFFRDGALPFKDVYIHPTIQDGHGQRMSKTLGNGVDPLDLVHSHGADALRFGLCQVATATQDVRMPVDLICPHCGKVVEPKNIETPQGYVVAGPEQRCKSCDKGMVSAYGASSGQAKPDDARPLARNTSSRFDEGRNFCNKLWNASRFAMGMLGVDDEMRTGETPVPPGACAFSLPDRWMLSRLARAINAMDDALGEYQFSRCAEVAYDLLWRDFCDWYLESIKPTIAGDANQQRVLRTTLEAILRLLHPMVPFVTEAIYERLSEVELAGVEGLELTAASNCGLLCSAGWPISDGSLVDEDAEREFERLQSLVHAIRDVRSAQKVHPKRKITMHVGEGLMGWLDGFGGMLASLAGVGSIVEGDTPEGATAVRFENGEFFLSDLADAMDADAERAQLLKRVGELEGSIVALDKRLGNPGYTEKAPAHLVQQTRYQRSAIAGELEAVRVRLGELE